MCPSLQACMCRNTQPGEGSTPPKFAVATPFGSPVLQKSRFCTPLHVSLTRRACAGTRSLVKAARHRSLQSWRHPLAAPCCRSRARARRAPASWVASRTACPPTRRSMSRLGRTSARCALQLQRLCLLSEGPAVPASAYTIWQSQVLALPGSQAATLQQLKSHVSDSLSAWSCILQHALQKCGEATFQECSGTASSADACAAAHPTFSERCKDMYKACIGLLHVGALDRSCICTMGLPALLTQALLSRQSSASAARTCTRPAWMLHASAAISSCNMCSETASIADACAAVQPTFSEHCKDVYEACMGCCMPVSILHILQRPPALLTHALLCSRPSASAARMCMRPAWAAACQCSGGPSASRSCRPTPSSRSRSRSPWKACETADLLADLPARPVRQQILQQMSREGL